MDTRTEKEKMIAGDLYFSFGEELLGERQHAKALINKYNVELATTLEGRTVSMQRVEAVFVVFEQVQAHRER